MSDDEPAAAHDPRRPATATVGATIAPVTVRSGYVVYVGIVLIAVAVASIVSFIVAGQPTPPDVELAVHAMVFGAAVSFDVLVLLAALLLRYRALRSRNLVGLERTLVRLVAIAGLVPLLVLLASWPPGLLGAGDVRTRVSEPSEPRSRLD